MLRRLAFALLAVVFAAGFAFAQDVKKDAKEAKQATKDTAKDVKTEAKAATQKVMGTVKSVGTNDFVVTDQAGKDQTFAVDKDTVVHSSGASHKMDALKADGKPAQISEFLKEKEHVTVYYTEKDGKMTAKEVRVKK